jgi:uncharacterized membrane protein
MYLGLGLLGLFIGLLIAAGSRELYGALSGAAVGVLLAHLLRLERRVRQLERRAAEPQRSAAPEPRAAPERLELPAAPDRSESPRDDGKRPAPAMARPEAEQTAAGPVPGPAPSSAPAPAPSAEPGQPATAPGPVTLFAQRAMRQLTDWFTTGNLPVKIGVILSFFGVAFLLKYAIDQQLFAFPIEFRLLAIAVGGLAMIVVGWRLRQRLRVYALSLQGGGCGILFLTIFAAFRIWQLLPASLALVLLAALAAFTGALAVLQNARALIILGAVGGFLAPVLASTGQGSHVALFSYYLVLNAAVLGVAWFRAWREVNLVGFAFTWLIGSFWGYRYYRPELFASTEPFLILNFLFYQAIAVLYALRQPPGRIGLVDGTLVFGTPVVAFALQAGLVRNTEYGLAISAAVVAVFYALLAAWLFRRQIRYLNILSESFIALAVAFATIAVPLALDARWTSAAWALEGAALVWIATRQSRHLAGLAGAALIFFSGFAFALDGWRHGAGWPLLNGNVLGGAMVSLSALFAARRLQHYRLPPLGALYGWIAWSLFAWGAGWWVMTGGGEIGDRVPAGQQAHAAVLFLALSAAGYCRLGEARDWSMARRLSWLFLPSLLWLAAGYHEEYRHFLTGWGWLAWPIAFAVQAMILRMLDRRENRIATAWHLATAALLALLLAMEAAWQTSVSIAGAWKEAAASAVPGVFALLIWRFRHRPRWPIPRQAMAYRMLAVALAAAQALYLAAVSLALPGHPGPVRYIPMLNPLDLALLFSGVVTLLSLMLIRRDRATLAAPALDSALAIYRVSMAATFLVLTTAALVRGVHFYASIPWDYELLARSDTVQTSLSIYWGLLGFAGMVIGARRASRWIWVGGAGFMGLVVIKLFLVDLGNSGTIERIVSFIGIGVLLLVVGYFAPVPPRQKEGPVSIGTAQPAGD